MIHLRIAETLLQSIRDDLRRPHDFAGERVGYLFCRGAVDLLVACEYRPLHDDEYELSSTVGAQFSGDALRRMLRLSRELQASAFNIHEHPWPGHPVFSLVDEQSLRGTVPGFFAMHGGPHGAIVLSSDSASGLVWDAARAEPEPLRRITSVGANISIWRNDGPAR